MPADYSISAEDMARHTELAIKKATGGLSDKEEEELTDLRKKKTLANTMAGNTN